MLKKYYRKLAKYRLIARYRYLIEVDKLMSEFVTKTILDEGNSEFVGKQRNQLVALENDIMSKNKLLEFLKRVK